jgi:transposase InsO family protein
MEELASLPAESRELALKRFELLRPYLDGLLSLRSVVKDQGIPYRTAARWVAGYRKDGLAALARKGRSDEGARRLATERMVEAIEGLALERPPLPISSIHRQATAVASTLGEGRPSYPVVRRIVRALPSGLTTLAHRGARAYGETFDLVHRREASRANAIWQVDHAQLDIRILQEDGSTARPWLTVVIDDYSRAVAGYYLGFEPPSSLRTALALRQGIWRKGDPHWEICGIPDTLYTDNGRISRRSISSRSPSISRFAWCSLHQVSHVAVDASNDFFERSTRCSSVTSTGMAQGPAAPPASPSRTWIESFASSCLRSITADGAQRVSPLPRRGGRKAPFCRACLSRWSNWIFCLSTNYVVDGYDPMAFTSIASVTSRSPLQRT